MAASINGTAAEALAPRNPERLREGLVRYLGYANEVGESFRPLMSARLAVNASYGIAGSYVIADAAWRSQVPPKGRSATVEAADTLIWQGLASVAIPGYVINRLVWAAGRFGPPQSRAWLPTVFGLACIPFIVQPIDHGTDVLLNGTLRRLYPSSKGA